VGFDKAQFSLDNKTQDEECRCVPEPLEQRPL